MQQITCLNCPLRCSIEVKHDESAILAVEGNNCERGYKYAIELINLPYRNLVTYVKVKNSTARSVQVTTTQPVPCDKIQDLEEMLAGITLVAPVKKQDIVLTNVLNTGIDIMAISQAL